ncbi:NAD-dependent epimerase/dehydratase family protein [Pseudanabaena sp. PCC 6802]|uniref:NAD-dependent epimerase/dehydratase family protein n=1 Tax=Pseudanabaena sp. PCC 6802 TaxID=118173 RepID=UPI00034DE8A5|nr:NAD(P)H-binding protein [Pseudanabaena sp. PCC 6802]
MKIGIVGANGFVGNRAVEILHLEGNEVRPIVRSAASIDRLTQKNLDCRIAGAFDRAALEAAFKGCDVIVHSILGSPGLIRGSIAPAYEAAQRAGVRRIIYLSSMIVHRSAPAVGTTEASPFVEDQPFPAHSAKIYAERKLLELRKNGSVEVVIFRPGIVFGPRSRWVIDLANQLSQGTAYFINEGKGICNSVYIDNLIHAIRLAMTVPEADGEAFFVGDRERVTWFEFYRPFAEAFGVDPTQIPHLNAPEFNHSWKQQVKDTLWNSQVVQKVLAAVSDDLKQKIKSAIPKRNKRTIEIEPFQQAETKPQPVVTEMMAELQQSQYKLPFSKAEKILGYEPIISFDEGCRRSIKWLAETKQFHQLLKLVEID